MKFDCILLAAGFSSRMNQWKLLREYRGKSLIKTALDNAAIYTEKVIVSGGYRIDDLREHLSDCKNIIVVDNPHFEKGMMTSIKAAIPYVNTDSFFITLGDLPLIQPRIYSEMSETDFDDVLFPVCNGRRGHPVLINSSLKSAIANADDFAKMKSVLSHYKTAELQVNSSGIYEDIDTDQDYLSILEK